MQCVPPKRQALSELDSITNQKSTLFIPSQFCPRHVMKDLKFSPNNSFSNNRLQQLPIYTMTYTKLTFDNRTVRLNVANTKTLNWA
jgi:hypothetical protein